MSSNAPHNGAETYVMKMAPRGYRAEFNARRAVDIATQLIARIHFVNVGSGMNETVPMHENLKESDANG